VQSRLLRSKLGGDLATAAVVRVEWEASTQATLVAGEKPKGIAYFAWKGEEIVGDAAAEGVDLRVSQELAQWVGLPVGPSVAGAKLRVWTSR
jgi:hypothetical protein